MKKIIYIAETGTDDNTTATAFFTEAEAQKEAEYLYDHLTNREKKTHTVSVQAFEIDCEADQSAEEAYRDWCLYSDYTDPILYREIHCGTYGAGRRRRNEQTGGITQ